MKITQVTDLGDGQFEVNVGTEKHFRLITMSRYARYGQKPKEVVVSWSSGHTDSPLEASTYASHLNLLANAASMIEHGERLDAALESVGYTI